MKVKAKHEKSNICISQSGSYCHLGKTVILDKPFNETVCCLVCVGWKGINTYVNTFVKTND